MIPAASAADTLRGLQAAPTAGDVTPLQARLTSEMLERPRMPCTEPARGGRASRVERIRFERAEVTEARQERGRDDVTVVLGRTLGDGTVDRTGAVVAGARPPERFEEFRTFTRPVGPNAWRLTAIQTA